METSFFDRQNKKTTHFKQHPVSDHANLPDL